MSAWRVIENPSVEVGGLEPVQGAAHTEGRPLVFLREVAHKLNPGETVALRAARFSSFLPSSPRTMPVSKK
jgi:hypothetical protein